MLNSIANLGAVIIYGRGAVQMGAINFSARKLRVGAKLQCKPFEGGGKISVHSHLKAVLKPQEITLKIFASNFYDSPTHQYIS